MKPLMTWLISMYQSKHTGQKSLLEIYEILAKQTQLQKGLPG